MPGRLIDYSDVQQAVVYVRVPGWLKNLVNAAARRRGLSVNDWAGIVLKRAAEVDEGWPLLVPHAAAPTIGEVVRDYVLGEVTLEPCGRSSPCEREKAGTHAVGGLVFCNHCRIRVS